MNKKLMILISSLILINISLVSAQETGPFWKCFSYGEKINFCNPTIPDRTCYQTSIPCMYCMVGYNETEDCYNSVWTACKNLVQECGAIGGNSTNLDREPPVLIFNNPDPSQYSIFESRYVIMEYSIDEKADVLYTDKNYGRGRWTRICNDCPAHTYTSKRSFREGLNELMFKAVDVIGNTAYLNVSFFVDSKKPRISKTYPRKGFADGSFEVQFTEENPKELVLTYGNSESQYYGYGTMGIGYRTISITDFDGFQSAGENSGSCYLEKRKYYCNINADLEDYDGQQIEYWVTVKDIANTVAISRNVTLDVDTTYPVINNPDSMFSIDRRYVTFNVSITEENFDEISYIDELERYPRWRRLCTRLTDGACITRKSFSTGPHSLSIQVTDEAGNAVAVPAFFDI